ncbi:FtsX-like permease family protein [Streptomyces sp. NPDC088147]|uniref:ABC transporter permease n=1 Tax=unclassified Streptomyces TaxID=2593676 RepID=UPI00380DD596
MNRTRSLLLGVRFAVASGREGWIRTLLTTVGVGLGAALLLLTAAIPNALDARSARSDARSDYVVGEVIPRAANTLLVGKVQDAGGGGEVRGRLVYAEGPEAPVPPGLVGIPEPGDMVVSPALKELLSSTEGASLKERLPYRVTGTIRDEGLLGPSELAYYAGNDTLRPGEGDVVRVGSYNTVGASAGIDPFLMLLVVVMLVVLLTPVGVFTIAALRFGGERRDRRLAALRLVGVDRKGVRWVAAGEALVGSVLGLVAGTGFFLLARGWIADVSVAGLDVFPADADPSPALVALIAVLVPVCALGVTLLAMRGVIIEPLGVVRSAQARRRRLWWRLLPTAAGLALLTPLVGGSRDGAFFNTPQVITGTVLLLFGMIVLLPWVIEAVVKRLDGGSVSWQLAVRRLQLSSGTAARLVSGIAVAVAGGIALQMLFTSLESDYVKYTYATDDMRVVMDGVPPKKRAELVSGVRGADGVKSTSVLFTQNLGSASPAKGEDYLSRLNVGDCASLSRLADLPSCTDGDVFLVNNGSESAQDKALVRPGARLLVAPSEQRGGADRGVPWVVPDRLRIVSAVAGQSSTEGVLATRGAVPRLDEVPANVLIKVDLRSNSVDEADSVREAASAVHPLAAVIAEQATVTDRKFANVVKGIGIGTVALLLLIGLSLLLSTLEQLRERKKLLAALVAFGTRRSTLGWSVLWQSALPVALGMLLASATGVLLGSVLQLMVSQSPAVDWAAVVTLTGAGGAVVVLTTLLSLPALWRLMRPDGLRHE